MRFPEPKVLLFSLAALIAALYVVAYNLPDAQQYIIIAIIRAVLVTAACCVFLYWIRSRDN